MVFFFVHLFWAWDLRGDSVRASAARNKRTGWLRCPRNFSFIDIFWVASLSVLSWHNWKRVVSDTRRPWNLRRLHVHPILASHCQPKGELKELDGHHASSRAYAV